MASRKGSQNTQYPKLEAKIALLLMVVDFRRAQSGHSPLFIDGSSVEIVKSTKFLKLRKAHPPPHPDHVLQRDHREHPEQLHHCLLYAVLELYALCYSSTLCVTATRSVLELHTGLYTTLRWRQSYTSECELLFHQPHSYGARDDAVRGDEEEGGAGGGGGGSVLLLLLLLLVVVVVVVVYVV
ncbi:hypothetical protein QTP86_031486 [Hemibagrus guttatus]|nr:hypothetical protein QTP86_031486 [Hemibagrus guttatus]